MAETQINTIEEFILVIDEFEGQDLSYLLNNFGVQYDFRKIKAYVGRIMINQDYEALQNEFEVPDLYQRCQGITFTPKFSRMTFKDGIIEYTLTKFTKNKRF